MQNNMIPLTVANNLDQPTKQRIEAKPNQTLKQAVQAEKLAPQGAFDVYDQLGKVISNTSVANHRDATVYVGVAKVAGGAFKAASLSKLKRSEYPSMRHINQHSTNSSVGAFVGSVRLWVRSWVGPPMFCSSRKKLGAQGRRKVERCASWASL